MENDEKKYCKISFSGWLNLLITIIGIGIMIYVMSLRASDMSLSNLSEIQKLKEQVEKHEVSIAVIQQSLQNIQDNQQIQSADIKERFKELNNKIDALPKKMETR